MSKNIDGGWAWVILTCGFCSFILNGFLCYSMGIITEAMLEVFEGDLTLTSAVGSAVVGAQCCIGPLAGYASKRVGSRACAILGGILAVIGLGGASVSRDLCSVLICGVLTGIGYGFPLTSCSVIVGCYFHRLRPLAGGIATTGAGLGMFIGPPVVRYLIDKYGLHGTFLVMAGISSHFCVIGSLLRPLSNSGDINKEVAKRQRQESIHCIKPAFITFCKELRTCSNYSPVLKKNVGFIFYCTSIYLWSVAESACILHLPNYCVQQGSSKRDTSLLFTVMGVSSILSKLLTGVAVNDQNVSSIIFQTGLLGIAGVVTVLFPFYSSTYGGQMAYATALGVYTTSVNSLLTPLLVLLLGLDDLPLGFGLVNLSAGLGYLTGPPVAGAIVDYGSSYRESYLFAGSVYLLASVCVMVIPVFQSERVERAVTGTNAAQEVNIHVVGTVGDNLDERDISTSQLDMFERKTKPLTLEEEKQNKTGSVDEDSVKLTEIY